MSPLIVTEAQSIQLEGCIVQSINNSKF